MILGTRFNFSELQLRQYCFRRWRDYVQLGMALETIDVSILVAQLRKVFRKWKAETWPSAYEKGSTASRLLRSLTSGFSEKGQQPPPPRLSAVEPDDDSANDEIRSQFSFGSKSAAGWLPFTRRT